MSAAPEPASRPPGGPVRERALALALALGPHALVALALLLAAAAAHLPLVHTQLDYEDAEWIRGAFPAYRSRVLQLFFMNQLLLPLVRHRVEGFFLFGVLLHFLCGLMIYALSLGLCRHLRTTLRERRWAPVAGGALAALLFVSHEAGNLIFLSGLSYQLFCLFLLLALLLSLAYLAGGRPWLWLAGAGAAALALLSHSYGLATPLLLAALELAWRRGRAGVHGRWNITWRYALHLLPVWYFLTQFSGGLLSDRVSSGRILGHLYDPTVLAVDALHFVNYMLISAVTLARKVAALAGGWAAPYPDTALLWSLDRVVAGAALLFFTAGGLHALVRRRRAGVALFGLLFVVCFGAATFHQTLLIGYDEMQDWRFYHNVAGLCLLLAFAAARALSPALARAGGRVGGVAAAALVLTCGLVLLGARTRYSQTLAHLIKGEPLLRNTYTWRPEARCPRFQRVTPEEAADRAANGVSLACADLSFADLRKLQLNGADLRGADLTGARMLDTWLEGANLRGAGLTFTDLLGSHLARADLRGANLTGASLKGTDLTGARLQGAVFVGAFRYNISMKGLTQEQIQRTIDRQVRRVPR